MRNRILLIAIALIAAFGLSEVKALSGGPDAYGYVWRDSNEPNGPSYDWVDITTRPGAVQISGLADDNSVGPFNIGFDFHYYWSDYSTIKVGTNGWLSFDNVGNIASPYPTIPSPGGAGDNIICPYMSDLTFISGFPSFPNVAEMWYWTNNVDSFIVQYVNVPWWQNGTPDWTGANNFEVLLLAGDSSVVFQYQNTDDANWAPGTTATTYMEIGWENVTGNIGMAAYSGTTLPPDNYAIKLYYPPVVTFQVPDATPAWNGNSDNAGQFVFTNTSLSLISNVGNVGNADITNTITIDVTIRDSALNVVWQDQSTLPSLNAGIDSTVTFPTALSLGIAGQYYYRVNTTNNQDINPSNNENDIEISAVDNNGGVVRLSYATAQGPDGALAWAGGGVNDGVGQKIVPPGYPAVVTRVSLWITEDGDPNTTPPVGFNVALYGEDAQGNVDLGNMLQFESIANTDVVEDFWNDVVLDTSVTINSGGFFVAWLMQGTGCAIGTESIGPKSRRGYEVLGGAWSEYRNNTTTEFLIRVYTDIPVSVQEGVDNSFTFSAYPNPTTDLSTIAYTVTEIGDVQFSLSNMMGQVVWNDAHNNLPAGNYQFNMPTRELAKGVYFLNMVQNGKKMTKKIVVE
ncbi:MAG: T9SS type A sorting domain-containing protein [Bacteroidota bacterium]